MKKKNSKYWPAWCPPHPQPPSEGGDSEVASQLGRLRQGLEDRKTRLREEDGQGAWDGLAEI